MKKTPAIKSWLLRHCGYTVTVWSFIIAPLYTPTCNAFCVVVTIKFFYLLAPVEIFGCWNIEVMWGFWLWRNTSGKNSEMFMLMLVCCQDINVALKSIENQFISCSSTAKYPTYCNLHEHNYIRRLGIDIFILIKNVFPRWGC